MGEGATVDGLGDARHRVCIGGVVSFWMGLIRCGGSCCLVLWHCVWTECTETVEKERTCKGRKRKRQVKRGQRRGNERLGLRLERRKENSLVWEL